MDKRVGRFEITLCISIITTVLLCSSAPVAGQNKNLSDPIFIIGGRLQRGFIIRHTKKLKDEVTQSNPWSIETEAIWHLRKRGIWDYCYCYPRTGISLNYTNFDLPAIIGSAISVYPFIEPYIRAEKPLHFSVRFGMGPAYMTKPWDEETNPDNLFFSARISFFLSASFGVNYRFSDHLSMRFAGNYNHISNGGYSEPNLGINFPSLNLGLDYNIDRALFEEREKDPDVILNPKKNRFDLTFGISGKPTGNGKDTIYPVFVVNADYSRVVGRILAITAGTEWVNDRSIRTEIIENNRLDESGKYLDHNRFGALVGVDWLFGRIIFYQQFGYYLYSPVRAHMLLYQRYGLSIKLTDHLFIGINLKAHGGNADFMDFRIGIYF